MISYFSELPMFKEEACRLRALQWRKVDLQGILIMQSVFHLNFVATYAAHKLASCFLVLWRQSYYCLTWWLEVLRIYYPRMTFDRGQHRGSKAYVGSPAPHTISSFLSIPIFLLFLTKLFHFSSPICSACEVVSLLAESISLLWGMSNSEVSLCGDQEKCEQIRLPPMEDILSGHISEFNLILFSGEYCKGESISSKKKDRDQKWVSRQSRKSNFRFSCSRNSIQY